MSKLPADMPQEDIETKSLLTLILDKVAELWTNIQSGFNNLTNHVSAKTIQINSDSNRPLNVQADDIANMQQAFLNVLHTQRVLDIGGNVTLIRRAYHQIFKDTVLLDTNGACELMGLMMLNGSGTKIRITIDEIYYDIDNGGITVPLFYTANQTESIGMSYVALSAEYELFRSYRGSPNILHLNYNALTSSSSSNRDVIFMNVKAHSKMKIEYLDVDTSKSPFVEYAILVRGL